MKLDCGCLTWIFLFLLLVIAYYFTKSNFGSNLVFNLYEKCQNKDNRQYPEGKVPGSYLGLSTAERDNLLTKFVNNNPNNLT
jgi:hypothetical protein